MTCSVGWLIWDLTSHQQLRSYGCDKVSSIGLKKINIFGGKLKVQVFLGMPDMTGIFGGWSVNLSNFLGLRVEAGASPMYPQKMRVPPPPPSGLILSPG